MSINTYAGITNPGYNNPAYYNPSSFGYSYQSSLFGSQLSGMQTFGGFSQSQFGGYQSQFGRFPQSQFRGYQSQFSGYQQQFSNFSSAKLISTIQQVLYGKSLPVYGTTHQISGTRISWQELVDRDNGIKPKPRVIHAPLPDNRRFGFAGRLVQLLRQMTARSNSTGTASRHYPGGYDPAIFNPRPLNPVWGNSNIPYNYAKSAPGLFGNIHGLSAIIGRYVADTMPTPLQDPTAPGNTWIYATIDNPTNNPFAIQ